MVWVKCQINQIAALIKVSILQAKDSKAVRSVAVKHEGTAAVEAQGA